MPTVITTLLPLCPGLGLGTWLFSCLLFAGVASRCSGCRRAGAFKFGVAYGNVFGHRGFYPFTAVCLHGADTLRTGRATMVQGKLDALLAVFNRVAAVAQPAGFRHHRRQGRRLAVAVVR